MKAVLSCLSRSLCYVMWNYCRISAVTCLCSSLAFATFSHVLQSSIPATEFIHALIISCCTRTVNYLVPSPFSAVACCKLCVAASRTTHHCTSPASGGQGALGRGLQWRRVGPANAKLKLVFPQATTTATTDHQQAFGTGTGTGRQPRLHLRKTT